MLFVAFAALDAGGGILANNAMIHLSRMRLRYAVLALLTIGGGLASRTLLRSHPSIATTYGGDVLWAAMMYWLVRLAFPRAAISLAGAVALGIATAVEFGQLCRAEWIVALRATRLGSLALGRGFLWSDLICYATGVTVAIVIDIGMMTHARAKSRP